MVIELKKFYDYMEQQKHRINAVFIFVYNDEKTYDNDPHLEECFDDIEVHEILDSVSDLFEEIFSFGSEKDFISWVCSARQIHLNQMVLQNLHTRLQVLVVSDIPFRMNPTSLQFWILFQSS